MNKRPGHVNVTTELGYCSVCGRPRNLRREQHQLGTFVRTVVTCETCHRTLSSTMGVANPEATADEPVEAKAEAAAETTSPETTSAAPKSLPAKRAAATVKAAKTASPNSKATKARTTKSS